MDPKNKNLWISIAVVAVLALALFWLVGRGGTEEPVLGDGSQEMESTEDTSAGSVTAPSAPALTYAQALAKYEDARIQIRPDCQVVPNNMTFKNGTSVMLDNRSPSAQTVKLGSTYSIKAWGFKVVKLSSATVPATWLMDCGASQNVATVLIQK